MKNLITADFHVDRRVLERDGKDVGIEEMQTILDFIYNLIVGQKVDRLLVLGDVYHRPNPSSFYHHWMIREFRRFSEKAEVVVLEGNHDYNQSGTSALKPIEIGAGVRVITKDSEDLTIGDHFACIPHVGKDESVDRFLNRFREQAGGRVALGHLEIDGAATGSENYLLGGSPISLKTIPFVNFAILGHIHKPQEFVSRAKLGGQEITYVGSPKCTDFGEMGETKRVILYDDELGTSESIPTPCYRFLEYNWSADSVDIDDEEISGSHRRAVVKVNILSKTTGFDADGLRKKLESAGAIVHSVNVHREVQSLVRDERVRVGIPPSEALSLFLERADGTLDKVEIQSLGEKVLSEVMSL